LTLNINFIKIFIMNLLFFSLLLSFKVQFIENRGIFITWQSKEPLKEVQILYSPSGKNYYKVAIKRYSFPRNNIKDTFIWVFEPVDFKILNKIKEKAKIKLVYITENNNKEEVLSLKDLKLECSFKIKEKESKVSNSFSSFDYGTYPAWPMFQVDPQHTGQYPYAVYPPLQYQWTYTLDYNDFLMISASISSNGVIYIGDGGRFLRAIDIKTGNILWERGLTANVWTTALVNDTLVLAGTSISFDTTMPTLFLINARTGDTVWGRMHSTMEIQPLVVDTLIYVVNPDNAVMVCWNLKGNIVWTTELMDTINGPSFLGGGGYSNNAIYIGDVNKAMLSLDANTGDLIWEFKTPTWVFSTFPLLSELHVHFFSAGTLYVIDENVGNLIWSIGNFAIGYHPTPSYRNNRIFHRDFQKIVCRDAETGNKIWETNVQDTIIKHIVSTSNNLLFTMGDHHIYVLDSENGRLLYNVQFPGPYESWLTPWFWPLIYGPYVVITHLKNMYIYKGAEFNSPQNKNYFIFYPTLVKNQGYLYLNINKGENLKIEIFDIIGRKRKVFNLGYVKRGSNFYVLDLKDLSQGIYILKIKDKKQKILKGG